MEQHWPFGYHYSAIGLLYQRTDWAILQVSRQV